MPVPLVLVFNSILVRALIKRANQPLAKPARRLDYY